MFRSIEVEDIIIFYTDMYMIYMYVIYIQINLKKNKF